MAPVWFLLVFYLSINTFSETKPTHQIHTNERLNEEHDAVKELEEISNKEYKTVHGRILAVNMAHGRRKGRAVVNGSEDMEEANVANTSKLFQGDIDLDPELEEYIKTGGNSRNALRSRKRLWTSRTVPYRIPPHMSHITLNVQRAINEFHSKTCIRFVRYNSGSHRNYIEFQNGDKCSSKVGKLYAVPGRQLITLDRSCNNVPDIMHELMHAIGFFHEQSRMDRDKYVKIYWGNILPGFSDQFDKYTWKTIDDLGVSYDYQSIMHYDRTAFTKNGKPTIVAIGNENMNFKTPDRKLSAKDVLKINALYDCRKTQSFGWASWSGWTPCDNNCYRSRQRYCYNSGNMKSCGGNVNTYGVETETQKCPKSICPASLDGHWGRWSAWSVCSKTCNAGTRTRFRRCDNPPPGHGGKYCQGSGSERGSCTLKKCQLGCQDSDNKCKIWANSGECTKNEVWMKQNCKRSCQVCGGCVDNAAYKVQCPLWAKNGECKKNPIWMRDNCCNSCNGPSTVPTAASCTDSNSSCPAWAKLGECTKNPAWMKPNCKLSCKQC